jgi:hypothetical protein
LNLVVTRRRRRVHFPRVRCDLGFRNVSQAGRRAPEIRRRKVAVHAAVPDRAADAADQIQAAATAAARSASSIVGRTSDFGARGKYFVIP